MSKFAVIDVFICAYLSTTYLNRCINHPRKRLLKSYSAQCILRSLLRAVCQMPHVYIAKTWRRPQPVAGFTKGFRVSFKFERNVSNNFKYSYLVYWGIMFLPQMGCYGLRRNLRRDYICMHFLSNLNNDNILVSEIDCSCRYIIFF